jgi:cellulose synthase/poly-beta-1,6-N-acetylglucosamine synthase-like glycosyltransferase
MSAATELQYIPKTGTSEHQPPNPERFGTGSKPARPPALQSITDQVHYYEAALLRQQRRQAHDRQQLAEARAAYAAAATEAHTINGRPVRVFAPFRRATSAFDTITPLQVISLLLILGVVIGGIVVNVGLVMLALMVGITLFYFLNLVVTLLLSARTLDAPQEVVIPAEVVRALAKVEWPRYTILCPLYKEEAVVQQFAAAMLQLDYPVDKLEIFFLTEEDDEGTRRAIREANLPPHFRILTAPDGQPRTKPRACNYGLLEATGEFIVIYDAEDVPDPLQLKRAVMTFAAHPQDIGCVQAKLNFYNVRQNLLTRLFTVEYSTWFDSTLPGLQLARFALPLGGTSNHFRTPTLQQVGAWDAFNVTEDCDLGLRLTERGYRTLVLDSSTFEEANPNLKNWIRQRSRWIKGYMQTYLIHMRRPWEYLPPRRWMNFFSLQLIVGGRTAVLLVNPITWLLTALYFILRPYVEPYYNTLFPGPVLYLAVLSLVFGNLTYIYTHFLGCFKRRQYGLVKWALLMPLYWVVTSYAAYKALHQLITKPHYWEKTVHGLHLTQHPPAPAEAPADDGTLASPGKAANLPGKEFLPPAALQLLAETNRPASDWLGQDAAPPPRPVKDRVNVRQNRLRESLARLRQVDRWLLALVLLALVSGLVATAYLYSQDYLMLYADASSRLGISRWLFDSSQPGLAQLGGVWLPLPHLLMMPFAMIDPLFHNGLVGAAVSIPSHMIASLFIYLCARRLTGSRGASFIGTLAFTLNPNLLYLQATPLTESLTAATICAASYYFIAWMHDQRYRQILYMAIAAFLCSLVRYDGWALCAMLAVLIPFISIVRSRLQARYRLEANTIFFGLLGFTGIALWVLWCALIFGDALYFQRGEFSAQTNNAVLDRPYENNLFESLRFFGINAGETSGWVLVGLAVLGLAVYSGRAIWKRQALDLLAFLPFTASALFYIYSLYRGQIIIYLPELGTPSGLQTYFNNRYGVIVIPLIALGISALVAMLQRLAFKARTLPARALHRPLLTVATGLLIVQFAWILVDRLVVLEDGLRGMSCRPTLQGVEYLADHYDGGRIVFDAGTSFYYYVMGQAADIPYSQIIYQGTSALWANALHKPAETVDWIVMNPNNPADRVARVIDSTNPRFRVQFAVVAQEPDGTRLYRRTRPEGFPAADVNRAPNLRRFANDTCNPTGS